MTDPVDQMLRDAGERWRATQPDAPALRPIRQHSWALLAGAAAAVVAVTGGALYVSQQEPPASFMSSNTGDDPLVATDGTVVEATGRVKRVLLETRFCAPVPIPARIGADDCPTYVVVTGVDLDRLQNGQGHLRGTWRRGELTVTSQEPPESPAFPTFSATGAPTNQQVNAAAEKAVHKLMEDRANGMYLAGRGDTGAIQIELVVLTPEIKAKLDAIPGGSFELKPWLRPVR